MKHMQRMFGFLAVATLIAISVAVPAFAGDGGSSSLGIAAPTRQMHSETWGSVIPIALGMLGALGIVGGLVSHHSGLALAGLGLIIGIGLVGTGIPWLMSETTELQFGATLSELDRFAPYVADVVGFVLEGGR